MEQESVREGAGYPEVRAYSQVLSLEQVLPQFSDRAAPAMGIQTGREAGLHVDLALQMGKWVADEYHLEGGRDSGLGLRDGWVYDVPQDGPAQVHVQPAASFAMSPWLSGHQGSNGDSSAFHRVGSGGAPLLDCPPVATSEAAAIGASLWRSLDGLVVKLGTYDGLTCLETFLAGVRNFATYYSWMEEDELLFCRPVFVVRQASFCAI